MTEPADTPEASRARLESEIAEFQTRIAEQDALNAERAKNRAERAAKVGMDGVLNLAEIMPDVLASFERTRASIAAFAAEIRPQFDALTERPCKRHPLVMRSPAFEETCQRSRAARVFTPAFAPCSACTDDTTREAYREFWRRRGVEERNIDSTLSNFVSDQPAKTAAHAKVCAWQNRDGLFLLLYGNPGTGKGHLATGCLKSHGSGLFVKQGDMLRQLRDSYETNSTTALIGEWQTAGLLVIDEFGVSGGGKDEGPMLYQVLAERYDKRRPTIITSNLSVNDIRASLTPALLDRLKSDLEQVPFAWESYRSAKP